MELHVCQLDDHDESTRRRTGVPVPDIFLLIDCRNLIEQGQPHKRNHPQLEAVKS
jgi:hypothetical protein